MNRMNRKLVAFSAIILTSVGVSSGAIIFSGAPVSENFDTVSPATVTGQFSATAGLQNTIPGLATWDGAKIAGTGTANMNFTADAGAANSGALYSYGAAGSGERALGGLASGSNTGAFGVVIQNGSGQAISDVTIRFTAEQWRSSTTTTNVLAFAYGVTGAGPTASDYLSVATMTALPALDAPGKPFVAANAATDGNDPNFQTSVMATFPVSVPAGDNLFIRWSDFNDIGNDAGVAIDTLTFSATLVPEPTSLALIAVGAVVLASRKLWA